MKPFIIQKSEIVPRFWWLYFCCLENILIFFYFIKTYYLFPFARIPSDFNVCLNSILLVNSWSELIHFGFSDLSITVVVWKIPRRVNAKLGEILVCPANIIFIASTVFVLRNDLSFKVEWKSLKRKMLWKKTWGKNYKTYPP